MNTETWPRLWKNWNINELSYWVRLLNTKTFGDKTTKKELKLEAIATYSERAQIVLFIGEAGRGWGRRRRRRLVERQRSGRHQRQSLELAADPDLVQPRVERRNAVGEELLFIDAAITAWSKERQEFSQRNWVINRFDPSSLRHLLQAYLQPSANTPEQQVKCQCSVLVFTLWDSSAPLNAKFFSRPKRLCQIKLKWSFRCFWWSQV